VNAPALTVLTVLLAALHFLVFRRMDVGVATILFASHAFVLWVGGYWWSRPGIKRFVAYLAGVAALYFALVAYRGQPLLYALAVVFYAAAFARPVILLFFGVLLLAVMFTGTYWPELTLIGWLVAAGGVSLARRRAGFVSMTLYLVGAALVAALFFPILHAAISVSPQTLLTKGISPDFLDSLWRTVSTATISTGVIVLFGVPLAYVLARFPFRGKTIVNTLVSLPILIPQSVVGLALMNLLGPKTPLGIAAEQWLGIRIAGSAWAIVAVQVFVATPFLVRTAAVAFGAQPHEMEKTARSLGASAGGTFWRVSLPLAGRGILAGCIMAWARAASESGALMIMAYEPKTSPIYIYDQFIQYGLDESLPSAVLLMVTGFLIFVWVFLVMKWLDYLRSFDAAPRGDLLLGGAR